MLWELVFLTPLLLLLLRLLFCLQGECETNPKYMLGDEGMKNGWCLPACGKCTPPAEEDAGSNALSGECPPAQSPRAAKQQCMFLLLRASV